MKNNDWKSRLSVVYSTNPDYQYAQESQEGGDTLSVGDQRLYVSLDKKNRNGKTVTLVTNFVGKEDDLKDLCKQIKSKCGVGGSAKDGEIIIQGVLKDRVIALLQQAGYVRTKGK